MGSTLHQLLGEFLPEETLQPIMERAKQMNVTLKVKKFKGQWHRDTLAKLLKQRGEECSYCDVHGDAEKLTLDHIIPKKVLLDMGLEDYYEDENNLEILCTRCNSRKASNLDFNNPKTIVLLEKYLALYKKRNDS